MPPPMPAALRSLPFPALAVVSLLALGSLPGVRAVPRLDLTPYPAPSPTERRWVIQLPGVLRPSPDPGLSSNPADWRVELIAGRDSVVDCNNRGLGGRLRTETLAGWGYEIVRVSAAGPVISTRMACPPDQPPRRAFLSLAGEPFLVRYNASLPIVVYAPMELEVRWRVWKAETRPRPASAL